MRRRSSAWSASTSRNDRDRWRLKPRSRTDEFALRLRASGAKLVSELACSVGDERTKLLRLEHDRLAAVGDDFADDPVGAPDRLVGNRGAVDERTRALLDLPARDVRRIPDACRRRRMQL